MASLAPAFRRLSRGSRLLAPSSFSCNFSTSNRVLHNKDYCLEGHCERLALFSSHFGQVTVGLRCCFVCLIGSGPKRLPEPLSGRGGWGQRWGQMDTV